MMPTIDELETAMIEAGEKAERTGDVEDWIAFDRAADDLDAALPAGTVVIE